VERVIPVAIRRWRKRPLRDFTGPEWRGFRKALKARRYDAVIDAQGLLKSAFVARLVHGPRFGPDQSSARERLAALAYDHPLRVPRDLHAVERNRLLISRALGYPLPRTFGDYGLATLGEPPASRVAPQLMFLHGSAQHSKLWPEADWLALARQAAAAGYGIWLPWGSEEERARARRIAAAVDAAEVLPRQSLRELATRLQQARGAVAVDTGLGHLAAALATPTVSLYGPTSSRLVGTYGNNQVHLVSPLAGGDITDPATLMQAIRPDPVWKALQSAIATAG
jgi:heptosyltransferase-1